MRKLVPLFVLFTSVSLAMPPLQEYPLETKVRSVMAEKEKKLTGTRKDAILFQSEISKNLKARIRDELCSIEKPYHCGFEFSVDANRFEDEKLKTHMRKQADICVKTGHPVPCWGVMEQAKIYTTRLERFLASSAGIKEFKKLLKIPSNVDFSSRSIPESEIDLLERCTKKVPGSCAILFWKYAYDNTFLKCMDKKTKFCKLINEKLISVDDKLKPADVCKLKGDNSCQNLDRKNKEQLLASCLDEKNTHAGESCLWVIADKVKYSSKDKALIYKKACLNGSYCFEARGLMKSESEKETMLFHACANYSTDARCSSLSNRKTEMLLFRCSQYGGNHCFGYLWLRLKSQNDIKENKSRYIQDMDSLCKLGYNMACAEASRLVMRTDFVKGMDYLEMICSEEFSTRDGCISLASAQFVHGSIESARPVIEKMKTWSYFEDVEENLDWIEKNGQKRYESDLKGIDLFVEKN